MNAIEKINIVNYKCFKGGFTLTLNEGINIIVGNNEAGKSTIIEAIHLALSGLLNGRYLKNELSQYIFNKEIETMYLESLKNGHPLPPPVILIEIFFSGDNLPELEGDGNTSKRKASGIRFKIEFDSQFQTDYEELIQTEVTTIPIEFYKITWTSFARESVTVKSIPVKSVLIDSTSTRFQNGSDVYISKIIKDDLVEKEIVDLSQAYRKLKEAFMADKSVEAINKKITGKADISTKTVSISVDLSAKNSWETSLMTYLEGIPFHQIGKGEQCLIKTNLALAHKKAKESNLILIEEPENHLSHSKLNQFIKSITAKCEGKQIIITTHSSFVANKLNLKNLILLSSTKEKTALAAISKETYEFFEKLPGYETLRMLLCKKAILVEGPSDELIVQRAFMDKHEKALPIEKEIDVISVGLTFKRFLEVAAILKTQVAVVTDNDGDYDTKITGKYVDYDDSDTIEIFADKRNELRTLEPQLVDANKDDLELLCEILEIDEADYNSQELISAYMIANKTECALNIFSSEKSIKYPEYINDVIEWCDEE
ncbi:MAG: ATP-dependent endonuclease [Bacteroidetes bacterium HGW-Bacteroidetes-17]|jgi:putative ATP-dependent endonuclease of OLD family|nr:MAG: ATP-dependent endonuclease [Bacteroidetes bacterium HGW-Bacteroidetes-17]